MLSKRLFATIISALWLGGVLFAVPPAIAQETPSLFERVSSGAQKAASKVYGTNIDPEELGPDVLTDRLIIILNSLFSFLAVIFFLLLVYAGYIWMMARGNESEIEKAKKMTREVVIGLLIIVLARIITEFVLTQIGNAVRT